MKNLDNNKNNLLRFLAGLAVVAVLSLLTAGTCDIKVKKDDDPPFTPGNTGGCTAGFKVELGNTKFASAFEVGTFSEDATSKAFKANVTLDLSKLTHANGFVSNHVWIHDTKINPLSFMDMGTQALPANDDVHSLWEDGDNTANTAGANFDGILCTAGKAAEGKYITQTAWTAAKLKTDITAGTTHEVFEPIDVADGKKGVVLLISQLGADTTANSVTNTGAGSHADEKDLCKDIKYQHGAILQPGAKTGELYKDGKLPAGFTGPFAGDPDNGSVNTPLWDKKFETKMNETGAYYVRANFGYEFEEAKETANFMTGAGAAWTADNTMDKVMVTKGSVGHPNDSDKLYDEVKAIFATGGKAMALLSDVFALDNNMGLPSVFAGQPIGTDAANGATAFTQIKAHTGAPADTLGTDLNGGWQKAFTIKPCDDKLKNGFAVAYGFATADAMTTWASDPSLEFADATATPLDANLERKVVIRQGTKDKVPDKDLGNSTAMIFESMVSPKYVGDGTTGFFTYRHDAADGMTEGKNAMATKGVLFCRSALALEGTTAKARITSTLTAAESKTDLEAYDNTTIGYFDGEVKTTSKGLGLTCYLGLSALWPTAIDKAPKLTKTGGVHNVQDVKTDKKDAGKYDYSDKHLGLFMVNIDDKTPINHAALKPFFSGRFGSGVASKKTADNTAGKAIVKAIKDDTTGKVSYLHGHVTVKFKK